MDACHSLAVDEEVRGRFMIGHSLGRMVAVLGEKMRHGSY